MQLVNLQRDSICCKTLTTTSQEFFDLNANQAKRKISKLIKQILKFNPDIHQDKSD